MMGRKYQKTVPGRVSNFGTLYPFGKGSVLSSIGHFRMPDVMLAIREKIQILLLAEGLSNMRHGLSTKRGRPRLPQTGRSGSSIRNLKVRINRPSVSFLLLLLGALIFAPMALGGQNKDPGWAAWQSLIGDWVGEGKGTPGEATGGFSFSPDLQGRVLVRRNWAGYPEGNGRPAFKHDDLMVIYHDSDNTTRATYYDNEGHVIDYRVSVSSDGQTFTFISDASPSTPRFRFVYSQVKDGHLSMGFDIAPPGEPDAFKPYIKATAHRKSVAK